MKRTRAQITSQLTAKGLAFLEFTLVHEGDYAPEDAEWNYKDVPHLNYVHKTINDTWSVVEEDMHAYINIRKDFPLALPTAVLAYQSRPNALTYYTTWFFYAVVVESVYDEIGFNRTRVSTTYSIGAPKPLRWSLGFLRWAITRNYHSLMADDIPMRERRSQLRLWGYSFITSPSHYSWQDSTDITRSNLKFPESLPSFTPLSILVEQDLASTGVECLLGKDDHLGLRIVRSNGNLLIYPRLCPHEGASLDKERCLNRKLTCPWHGRVFSPLAVLDLSQSAAQHASTEHHEVVLVDGKLTIKPKQHSRT